MSTGPGLGTDIMARPLADGVSRTLAQQICVENAPGASGIIRAQQATCATPDGYTQFFANASTFTSVCNQDPLVVSVYTELPMMTLPELIAYGKARPGKLSYAVDAAWAWWLPGS